MHLNNMSRSNIVHTTKQEEFKVLKDGAIAYRVRCCGDEKTDSWITIYGHHTLSDEDIDAHVNLHAANVESVHMAVCSVLDLIDTKLLQDSTVAIQSTTHNVQLVKHEHVLGDMVKWSFQCCNSTSSDFYIHKVMEKTEEELLVEFRAHIKNTATEHHQKGMSATYHQERFNRLKK
jgi:hypothetical protein